MTVLAEQDAAKRFSPAIRLSARRLAIWSSLGLICLAAVAALMLMQSIDRQIRDIAETYSVRNAARELTHALSQADASQRGYLLTADRRFLEPYEAAVGSIDGSVSDLLSMVAGDADQTERVSSITGDIAGKVAEMERTVELVSSQRQEEAQSLSQSGLGVRIMGEINATLEDFIAEEDQKLELRNRAIDQTRTALIAALIAALAAAVILASALLTRTQRQVHALTQRHRGLLSQNEALEAEVAQRTRDIEEARAHAERERERVEALLQDTNHRIGNSLATVSSLLALQMMRSKSDEVRDALEAARQRVHAIASAHRRLRLGDDLESACAEEFLSSVIEDIVKTQTDNGRIAIRGEIEPLTMSARDATTVGILASELITNALKHAFPDGRRGSVLVSLFRDSDGIPTLRISDDGIGMQMDQGEGEKGLGSAIVRQLSGPFGAEPHYVNGSNGGLCVSISLRTLARAGKKSDEVL